MSTGSARRLGPLLAVLLLPVSAWAGDDCFAIFNVETGASFPAIQWQCEAPRNQPGSKDRQSAICVHEGQKFTVLLGGSGDKVVYGMEARFGTDDYLLPGTDMTEQLDRKCRGIPKRAIPPSQLIWEKGPLKAQAIVSIRTNEGDVNGPGERVLTYRVSNRDALKMDAAPGLLPAF